MTSQMTGPDDAGIAAGQPQLPARLKVSVTAEVAAEPALVWAVVGNFQDMSWHPAVHSTTGKGGSAPGATRSLTLGQAGGPTIEEVLDECDSVAMRYSYRITAVGMDVLPVTGYSSRLAVHPGDGGGSRVEWHGSFRRGSTEGTPPDHLGDSAAVTAVKGVYQAGLDALLERFGAPQS